MIRPKQVFGQRSRFLRSIWTVAGGAGLTAAPSLLGIIPDLEFKGDVSADVTASYFHTTNVFGDARERSDFGQSILAGADYIRQRGRYGLTLRGEAQASSFDTFSGENNISPSARLTVTRLRGRTTGDAFVAYSRENRTDEFTTRRLTAERWHANVVANYDLNSRNSIKLETSAEYVRFPGVDSAVSLRMWSIGADWVRLYSRKLQYFGGYRFRHTFPANRRDTYDHAISAGLTGDLLPKITGTARLGLQTRQFSAGGSSESLHSSATLTWTPLRRISVAATGSRDFHTDAFDRSINATSINLQTGVQLGAKTSMSAGAGYSRFSFVDLTRKDDLYRARWRIERSLTSFLTAGGSVSWTRSDSTEALADHETVFSQIFVRADF